MPSLLLNIIFPELKLTKIIAWSQNVYFVFAHFEEKGFCGRMCVDWGYVNITFSLSTFIHGN